MAIRWRELGGSCVLAVAIACAALTELFGRIALYRATGRFGLQALRASLDDPRRRERRSPDADVAPGGSAAPGRSELHPYFGASYRPGAWPAGRGGVTPPPANELGFPGDSPLTPLPEPTLRVAIVGGSVAMFVAASEGARLERALGRLVDPGGAPVALYSLSKGGARQPQQLMAVQYLMSLGVRFDLVIALDGYNEIALAWKAAVERQLPPFYPRIWARLSAEENRLAVASILAQLAFHDRRTDAVRSYLAGSPLRRSALVLSLWNTFESVSKRRRVDLDTRLSQVLEPRVGPRLDWGRPHEILPPAVQMWRRSSLLLHHALEATGGLYLHLLQPNQYVPGAKTLSAAEQRLLTSPDARRAVEAGYPQLRRAGEQLRAAGVRFSDLSGLFRSVEETLYVDSCCHLKGGPIATGPVWGAPGSPSARRGIAERVRAGPCTSSP